MLGFNYLKRKLGGGDKEVPANEQFYSPLRIAMHSTVSVSMVDWFASIPELNKSMVLPHGEMSVLAIGKSESNRNEIFNIYLKDMANEEFALQLFCSPNDNGKGMELREATIFRDVRTLEPQTEDEWEAELKDVGATEYELDGNKYKRVWIENHDAHVDMLTFDEKVLHGDDTLHYINQYMMYSRKLQQATHTPQQELLLVGVEETNDTAQMVTRIGLDVPLSTIKVQ